MQCILRRSASAACVAALFSAAPAMSDDYPRAGWVADLSTNSHGVNGFVTIVDADTVQVDNFYYDGLGASVYFYLATADTKPAFIAGQQIGPQLLGTVYTNGALTIDLPAGTTLDGQNAVSVWCVVANANFGSGVFVAPPPPDCPADLDGDLVVGLSDLGIILADYGCASSCVADIDGDDDTDLSDLGVVLAEFGSSCE